jgi:hypothetical protein
VISPLDFSWAARAALDNSTKAAVAATTPRSNARRG